MEFYIGFSHSVSKWKIGSLLIRLMDGGKSSHTYFKFILDDGKTIYAHANSHRVNILSESAFKKYHVCDHEYKVPVQPHQHIRIKNYIYASLGINYGYLPIVGILLYKMFKWCGLNRNIFADYNNTLHCTEMAYYILHIAGYELKYKPELDGVEKLRKLVRDNVNG